MTYCFLYGKNNGCLMAELMLMMGQSIQNVMNLK